MESHHSPLLSWAYYYQGKSMEELRQTLFFTTLELETTRSKAQEELKIRDNQSAQLRVMLDRAIRQRDEANEKYQNLLYKTLLLRQTPPMSGISAIEDEPRRGFDSNNGFSSSDCEDSIASPPFVDPIPPIQLPSPPELPLAPDRPLPEKGKFLQAVVRAGPLLETLFLAGPLPRWRHPPPPLDPYQIPQPPVVIPPSPPIAKTPTHLLRRESFFRIIGCNRKRDLCEGSDSSSETKYQRVVFH